MMITMGIKIGPAVQKLAISQDEIQMSDSNFRQLRCNKEVEQLEGKEQQRKLFMKRRKIHFMVPELPDLLKRKLQNSIIICVKISM